MKDTPLSVLTLLYQREFVLPAIFQNLVELRQVRRGLPITWYLDLSPRVSRQVLEEVDRLMTYQRFTSLGPIMEIRQAPFSPLAEKERFMELRHWQLQDVEPGFAILWDDDQVLAAPGELAEYFDTDTDLVYATKTFFWDNDAQIATHLPPHRSVFMFRRRSGDQFDLTRTVHAPADVHDHPRRVADLRGALLDYGYLRAEDRARCWSEYKRVGKLDAATFPLVQEPTLQEWPGPFPLRRCAR